MPKDRNKIAIAELVSAVRKRVVVAEQEWGPVQQMCPGQDDSSLTDVQVSDHAMSFFLQANWIEPRYRFGKRGSEMQSYLEHLA